MGTAEVRTRQYATLAYSHGSGAEVAGATYAYAVLPGADLSRTKDEAQRGTVTVLRNDATAQAVGHQGGVTAANFWKPGTVGDFTASSSLCLIARTNNGIARISVSDPTQAQSTVTLVVANSPARRVRGADASRVSLARSGSFVTLTIDVSESGGRTVEFALHR
ncbi:MAG: polysaccharide lyase beta-sandwich domain-containing protein [Humibacillus sp.]